MPISQQGWLWVHAQLPNGFMPISQKLQIALMGQFTPLKAPMYHHPSLFLDLHARAASNANGLVGEYFARSSGGHWNPSIRRNLRGIESDEAVELLTLLDNFQCPID